MLDEVERFADQKEEIRNQTMRTLEPDGRVDGVSTQRLETRLWSSVVVCAKKKMRHIYRWQKGVGVFICITPQHSEQLNWGEVERPPSHCCSTQMIGTVVLSQCVSFKRS